MACRALDLKGICDDDDCGGSEMRGVGISLRVSHC